MTTDKHASYQRAIRRTLGRKVLHRTSQYLNNRIEPDYRGVKQRALVMGAYAPLLCSDAQRGITISIHQS